MNLTFETELEDDGRWLAEVPEIGSVMAYVATQMKAMAQAAALRFGYWPNSWSMAKPTQ